jgi:hypothetical protein
METLREYLLDSITYNFIQEGNTNGSTVSSTEDEKLSITVESVDESIEKGGGFLIIRTETGWSVNDSKEFYELLKLVESGVSSSGV